MYQMLKILEICFMFFVMLDLSKFGENLVTEVNYMFSDCTSLIQIDLGNFCWEKINDVLNMFDRCENLANIDMRKFNMINVVNYEGIFDEIPKDWTFIYNIFSDDLISLVLGSREKIAEKNA